MDKNLSEMASAMGKRGGNITKKRYGKGYYESISKLGVLARKKNLIKKRRLKALQDSKEDL